MKTLNLVDLDKSDIKYKIQKFPDGHQNVVLNPDDLDNYSEGKWIEHKVQIKSRLNNWLDLELIICAVASLRELGTEEMHLNTPYIIGAGSDRKFEEGGNNYLKDVICPIINSLNFKTITCIDPHSDMLEACIKGFRKDNKSHSLLCNLLEEKYQSKYGGLAPIDAINEKCILVSPDAGASKKIYKLAEQIGYKGDIITCSKDRDTDGKLTKVNVPISLAAGHGDKDMIIIGNICNDGVTFINIAKRIKEYKYNNKIYLIVTHGIFSKGFEGLSQYFDGIYCTNSYKNIIPPINYTDTHYYIKNNIKQLNVF